VRLVGPTDGEDPVGAEMLLQNVNRVVAWLLLSAVVVLSVVPANSRPTTFVPHKAEHAAIFLAAGICFGMAYLGREMAFEYRGDHFLRGN
jgi:hypothetical protein